LLNGKVDTPPNRVLNNPQTFGLGLGGLDLVLAGNASLSIVAIPIKIASAY
jgi:hypothetical protein